MQTSKRLFALSRIPQADYNTPVTPDDSPQNYEQVVKEGYDFADLTTTEASNAGFSTGTPNPTVVEIDRHDAAFSLSERMTAQRLGRRAVAAFGLPVSTPVVGSTGAHKHIFVPLNPQLESDLPSFTYVEKEGEPADEEDITDDRMLPSAKMETFDLSSGAENAYLMGASAWRGSGKVVEPSGVTFGDGTEHVVLEEDANENSIKSGQAIVKIYPQELLGGTPIEVLCDFRGVSMGFSTGTNFDAGYLGCGKFQTSGDPDSGMIRGSAPSGNPGLSLSFTLIKSIPFATGFNPLDKLRKKSKFSISFAYIGALIAGITGTPINYKALFKYTKLTVASVRQGDENGAGTYEIVTTPISIGQNYPFELELINNVPSYATLS